MNEEKSQKSHTDNPVVIKKYANRRLYNMQTSSYVTLEDLTELVKKDTDFVVKDAKSGKDLTRLVLTQIILEQESSGTELLSTDFLRGLIRYYDTGFHQALSAYLNMMMQMFSENRSELRQSFEPFTRQMKEILPDFDPMESMQKLQQQQVEWVQSFFGKR